MLTLAAMSRRFRGALVMAGLWALPWGAAGIAASPITRKLANALPPDSFGDFLADGLLAGWYGFLAGLSFSVVLAIASRRRSFSQLTTGRMLFWGLSSSVMLTVPPMMAMLASRPDGWRAEDPFYLGASLILSAGCAVATLWLARRADPDDREQVRQICEAEPHGASPLVAGSGTGEVLDAVRRW